MQEKSVVFYAVVQQTDNDGIFVDFPFLGGIVPTNRAEALARAITDDKGIPGNVITKVFPMAGDVSLSEYQRLARKQFNQMALDMYDMEDMHTRKERKRK